MASPDANDPGLQQAPSAPGVPRFVGDLDTLIRARYPLVYLVSWEEQRLDGVLSELATTHGKALYSWSVTRGMRKIGGARTAPHTDGPKDPIEALQSIAKLRDPALVVLKDFHPFLNDPSVTRALRELAQDLKSTYTTVLLVSPVLNIPVELEKEVSVLEIPLPSYRELYQLLREIVAVLRQGQRAVVDLNREHAEQLIRAAQGLTLSEAENAFAKAVANDGRLDAGDIKLVLEEKRQVIKKSGLLEYFAADDDLKSVGGLDNLKSWLSLRQDAFGEPARKFGIPAPKGLLMLGVQGCGKSLTAKAIASTWALPLVRLDMGRIFSGLVGSSEENLRKAIRVVESVSPAVLWVDEIEKGLAGGAGLSNDSGVTQRVFGALLTWLQEKSSPVFVVATANRIELMPPELLRKGRFDEIFFIDLPASKEREDIFRIHLARRERDPMRYNVGQLAQLSEGYSGAEIEQAVVSGLHHAFASRVELGQEHLMRAVAETLPLSTTMATEITTLREWARSRTRPASTPAHIAQLTRIG
ncbi:MAG: AAA family ATPase [Deltaproteobacteria bacterium]|nr:AAA family ATPase [Deltaproteobacteria bacterium]